MSNSQRMRQRLRHVREDFQRFDGDTGSSEVQGKPFESSCLDVASCSLPTETAMVCIVCCKAFVLTCFLCVYELEANRICEASNIPLGPCEIRAPVLYSQMKVEHKSSN